MGWQDKINTLRRNVGVGARQAVRGAQAGTARAYEGAKVAHAKYNAYQEAQYVRQLEQVRKKKAMLKEEAAVRKYQAQKAGYRGYDEGKGRKMKQPKETYGTSPRMERHSLQNQGYRVHGESEGRIRNNMDRQGGYQGGYKQYGGEAPLFARPVYKKNWWE
jgi:hypothetical protein